MGARAGIVIGLAAFGGVAFALARSASNGPSDGVNWSSLPYDFMDAAEVAAHSVAEVVTVGEPIEPPAQWPGEDLPVMAPADNVAAFLAAIRAAEGTDRAADPYRVVFGYGHTISNMADHPYFTGEWMGAPFGDGNWSTAAGAYQFIRRTWSGLKNDLGLADFSPASQDAAAIELIRQRGALADVQAGRFAQAVNKVRRVWASLPGAGYGQGERSLDWLAAKYQQAGGMLA